MEMVYLCAPIFLALYVFTWHFLHKLHNLPPTPYPMLPLIGHLYLLKKPLHRTFAKISDRHGPILFFRFGSRPVLIVSSHSAAEECFTKNDVVFADRPRLIAGKYLGYNYTSIGTACYGDHWRNLRRICTSEILSSNRLQMLSGNRSDEIRTLICGLFKNQNQAVEMKSAFFELTVNAMMRMIGGKRFYGENVGEGEEARKFREIASGTFRLAGACLVDFLPILGWLGFRATEKMLMELEKMRDSFIQNLIEEHRSKGSKCESRTKTMIEFLLSLQETEPENYSDEIIKGLVLVSSRIFSPRFPDLK